MWVGVLQLLHMWLFMQVQFTHVVNKLNFGCKHCLASQTRFFAEVSLAKVGLACKTIVSTRSASTATWKSYGMEFKSWLQPWPLLVWSVNLKCQVLSDDPFEFETYWALTSSSYISTRLMMLIPQVHGSITIQVWCLYVVPTSACLSFIQFLCLRVLSLICLTKFIPT